MVCSGMEGTLRSWGCWAAVPNFLTPPSRPGSLHPPSGTRATFAREHWQRHVRRVVQPAPLSSPVPRGPPRAAHRTTARQAMDGLWTEARGQQKQSNDPGNNQHILNTPTIGRR